ncbi:MAG: C39 family peptidase [Gammaproteobacteria bacterium]|nr:C39 family peptidase [Gammaproteobacteria bacterium]
MPADLTWRIAFAPDTRNWRYPLPLSRELEWHANGILTAEVALPSIPSGHIVVPSFASPDSPDHRWVLVSGDASHATAGFGRPGSQCDHTGGDEGLDVRVDYFETSRAMSNARLRLLVDMSEPPRDYLAAIGVRPAQQATDLASADTAILDIPARSQANAAPAELRPRICSPTCVSMAMEHLGVDHAFHELVTAAYHRATDLYGVWPQNIWAASRWGVIGAIETAMDWNVVERAVDGGHPLAASIAFGEGDLAGSAIPASDGHLVIVRGIQNNRVVVNDPAADDVARVPRHYDADEFRKAWLGARGACYLFAVPA